TSMLMISARGTTRGGSVPCAARARARLPEPTGLSSLLPSPSLPPRIAVVKRLNGGFRKSREYLSFRSRSVTLFTCGPTTSTARRGGPSESLGACCTPLTGGGLLNGGPCRYTALKAGLPGIASTLLAARLRDLEKGGILPREAAPPPVATTLFRLTP